jgi:hypothetical protein
LGENLPVITNVVKQNYQLNCPSDFSEQTHTLYFSFKLAYNGWRYETVGFSERVCIYHWKSWFKKQTSANQ